MTKTNDYFIIDIVNNNILQHPAPWSLGVIEVFTDWDFHDTGIDRYYFNTKIVSPEYNEKINWKINYIMFDLYNGISCLVNKTMLKTYNNSNKISISDYMEVMRIIENSLSENLNEINNFVTDDLLIKYFSLVSQSKIMLETTISFANMLKLDENFLLHAYKIQDTAKTFKKLSKSILESKDRKSYEKLENSISKIPKHFGYVSNNAQFSGLVSRHGHKAVPSGSEIPNMNILFDEVLSSFKEILKLMFKSHFIINNTSDKLRSDDYYYKYDITIDDLINESVGSKK